MLLEIQYYRDRAIRTNERRDGSSLRVADNSGIKSNHTQTTANNLHVQQGMVDAAGLRLPIARASWFYYGVVESYGESLLVTRERLSRRCLCAKDCSAGDASPSGGRARDCLRESVIIPK